MGVLAGSVCARKHTRIGTMASSDDDDWVLVTHLETWPRKPVPVRVSLRRALFPLSYASVSTCYTSRAAAVCQARKDWPRSRVYLTHCLASGVLTRERLQSPTDQFPLETIVCATQAVLALAIQLYLDHYPRPNLVVLDSRRPCLVTFADYGRCLHTKCLYLSCANTLQTRYVLNVSVFVDAYTKLSDVAVDTKQYI